MVCHLTIDQCLKKEYQSISVGHPLNAESIYILFRNSVYFFPHCATSPHWDKASLSRLPDHTQTLYSEGLLWTSDQPDAEPLYLTTHTTHKRQTSMPPAGFEPTIPGSERPQTHALDRAATGICRFNLYLTEIILYLGYENNRVMLCRAIAVYCKNRVDGRKQMVWAEFKASYL